MEYNTILAKSFSRYEQKKFGYGALLACLFIALSFFTVFKPSLTRLPILNLQLSMRGSLAKVLIETSSTSQPMVTNGSTSHVKLESNGSSTLIANKTSVSQLMAENGSTSQHLVEIGTSDSQLTVENTSTSQHMVEIHTSDSQLTIENTDTSQHMVENTSASNQLVPEKTTRNEIRPVQNVTFQNLHESARFPAVPSESKIELEIKPVCNVMEQCDIEGEVRVHGSSSTILFASSQLGSTARDESFKIKPYTRKADKAAMANVKEFILKPFPSSKEAPQCTVNHNTPAIVFSNGGYSGNHFHDFSDILVPLFLTSNQFHRDVQFLVTNEKSWWLSKYEVILKHLSKYDIIDIDKDDEIRCFPHVIVGLIHHKDFTIDSSRSPNGYSMTDFTHFLRSSYSLKREKAIRIGDVQRKKPRILIISRKRTRAFTNEGEIVKMARSVGYEVVVAEPVMTNFSGFAQIVNSCDVMMGVHGAGLTNSVFLPSNAILIQIVPLGRMDWLAKHYFGEPAADMNLRYLEYAIKKGESTLIQQYPSQHAVFTDPLSVSKHGWDAFKSVYLEKQNVKLDVKRFRATLLEALKLLHNKNQI